MDAIMIISAFLIIAAFLIGAYSMFRISEHYNKEFRRIIEERTERRVMNDIFDFEVEPEQPVRPNRTQRTNPPKRPSKPAEAKKDD